MNALADADQSAAGDERELKVQRVGARLRPRLQDRLTDALAIRGGHGRGEAFHEAALPDLVAFATSTEDVAAIVEACAAERLPVIAFGAGTSLEGGVTAPRGGVSLDLSSMDGILEVNAADLDCTVQAGVTREALNAYLRDSGLFFPIDPGANATIGGMAATRASGTMAVRYGTMKDAVLALKVVMADGTVVTTGTRARKTAAGYDLTRLLIGSEGTLGVITEVTLRLSGLPEKIVSGVCSFGDLEGAVTAVIETMQVGLPIARIEFLDEVMVAACNAYNRTALPEAPTLFLEFHGSPDAVDEQVRLFAEIAKGNGGRELQRADTTEGRSGLWRARHSAYHAAQGLRPGSELIVTDVCVPISRLAECVGETHAEIAAAGLTAPIVGHVGDGNFHVMFAVKPDDHEELERVRSLYDRLIDRALRMNGTCTGEHGIGLGKREKLLAEIGPEAVAIMRGLKAHLDPNDILNPGKIFID